MAQAQPFDGRERRGRVTVERFRDSIRLRWTLKGKTYSLTIGKDSKDTLRAARAKAQIIDGDIALDRFDSSLVKYGKPLAAPAEGEISLRHLWDEFLKDKLPHLKAKTQDEYHKFTALINKLGDRLSFNALDTKNALLAVTTIDQTKRMLLYLSACCKWGIKHCLIESNSFAGISAEMPKRNSFQNPSANAFTTAEMLAVIAAFQNSDYSHYAPLVEFWFLTGCRPSEAIGLTWDKVSENCQSIIFDGSIQTLANGSQVWSEGSKNNKSRVVSLSIAAEALLMSAKMSAKPETLVFPSPNGKPINYNNFCKRIWKQIVDPIKPETTPYNCRDTFITDQLIKGIPSAVIAKWCDTSISMIDKNYADKLKLSQIRPMS